jgi:GNAT superfamily N-acetyltransferase
MSRPESAASGAGLEIVPVTAERFPDLERLFGPRGACGGCWCMWWRLTAKEFDTGTGDRNRAALRALVDRGEVPGLVALDGEEPVGWCAVAPREAFPRLERSRALKRIDDESVWSIVCFYVAKGHRRRGVMTALVRGAIEYVTAQGGRILEAYPVIPKKDRAPAVFLFPGTPGPFLAAGFREVARRSEGRPILRYAIRETERARRSVSSR